MEDVGIRYPRRPRLRPRLQYVRWRAVLVKVERRLQLLALRSALTLHLYPLRSDLLLYPPAYEFSVRSVGTQTSGSTITSANEYEDYEDHSVEPFPEPGAPPVSPPRYSGDRAAQALYHGETIGVTHRILRFASNRILHLTLYLWSVNSVSLRRRLLKFFLHLARYYLPGIAVTSLWQYQEHLVQLLESVITFFASHHD